jgi:hypothetical protein
MSSTKFKLQIPSVENDPSKGVIFVRSFGSFCVKSLLNTMSETGTTHCTHIQRHVIVFGLDEFTSSM